jgi:hypothetical protein
MFRRFVNWLARKLVGEDLTDIERRRLRQEARREVEREVIQAELGDLRRRLREAPATERELREVIEELIRQAEARL